MASRIITIDDQLLYSDQESTSSSTPPPDDNNNNNNFNHKRRSWLSHLSSSVETTATTTPCSHRSSFSSTFSGSTLQSQHQPSPKPHKSNQPLWESIRRLRHEINSSRGGGGRHHEVGLEHFRLIKRVGSGDLGSVYLCQIRGGLSNSNSLYAMKVVDREALASRNKLGRAEIEREILCMLDHPFLPTLYAEFDASHYSCLVMEFCPGGDLYSARLKQPSKRFTVSSTKFYAAEVLLALEYLHMMGIIYRDLKPENVLVREDGHIMLSDFDLCLKCNDVVPKLLLHKQQTHNNNNYPRFTTSSSVSVSSSPPSPPPQPNNVTATPSCAGPLRPVLTSCFSLRRRRQSSTTTTITEYATSRHNDDNLSSVTDKHYSKSNKHRSTEWESEPESDYYNYSSDVLRHSSVMYQRWATEMVAEPIEARSKSFVGTHEYLAPEVISGQGHGSAVDWWTFGVFLYEMIFGVTPFKGENNEKTLRNILKQPLTFPPSTTYQYRHGEVLEMEIVKDLIRKLLVKNPKRRIGSLKGSVEIKKHEFFRGVNWALIRSVRPPVVPSEEMRRRGGSGSSKNVENNQVMKKMMMNDRDRKIAVMMMMKKKSTTTTNSTPRGFTSFMLPKVLSRKERDQPYQIPFHYDYYRSRHQHGQVNDQQQQYQRHLRRRDEQQPHNQHFEYF